VSADSPDRSISGLPPRRPAVAGSLIRGNRQREAPVDPLEASSVAEPAAAAEPAAPTPASPRRRTSTRGTPSSGSARAKKKSGLGVEIDTAVRDESRAAYRAAAYFENVPTYAQFVENAVAREVERLRQTYNDGKPFEPMTAPLPAGRPVGS
jgi:hypothetical protein